jgi:multimeric flavodoxin WrbA
VLISEITYGGFSADIKAFLDRSIQNILPYFVNYKGEIHHPMRYKRFPIWIAIGYGDVSNSEKQTFIKLAERNALNLRPAKYLAVAVQDRNDFVREAGIILKTVEADA